MSKQRGFRAGPRHQGQQPRVQGNAVRFTKDTNYWADLEEMNRNLIAAETGAGFVMPYLKHAELRARIQDQAGLDAAIQNFTALFRTKKEQRVDLLARWQQYRDSNPVRSPESLTQCLDYGIEYDNWLYEWATVVMYAGDVLLDFFRKAGADVPIFSPAFPGFREEAITNFLADQAADKAAQADESLVANRDEMLEPITQH